MENYFEIILMLYCGFLIIYAIHPEPEIFYRKTRIDTCHIDNKDKVCIEE